MDKQKSHIKLSRRRAKDSLSISDLKAYAHRSQAIRYQIPGTTHVEACYFFPQAKRAIFEWANKSLEMQPVVEVGGFLIGQYARSEKGRYQLVIKHFVAAKEVSFQSSHRLRLGPSAMLALDDALQAYPEDMLVGWFHTHPGHQPFFSEIDLATHHAFFKADYHVAMVIDPCDPVFPTVILARETDGRMTTEWNYQEWIKWKA